MATSRRRGPKPPLSVSLRFPSSFDVEPITRAAFVDRVTAAASSGDVVIVAPSVGNKHGRAVMQRTLREAGLSPALVSVLGWATFYDEPAPVPLTIVEPAPVPLLDEPEPTEDPYE